MKREIKTLTTKDGNYTLSINNVLLHSKYNPSNEADRFIENNIEKIKNKRNILVYGIGLGYHIQSIMNKADKDCNIYAFDADIEIINMIEELEMLNH